MEKILQKTIRDLVKLLSENKVDFAVIGGIAVIYRGEPRFTADIDLVILLNVEQTLSFIHNLVDSPFKPLFHDVEEVVQKSFILPLQHKKTKVVVDCALGMTGFEQQLVKRATPIGIGKIQLPVATAEDLLLLKLLAGRPRDMEDAHRIVARQTNSLDWSYLEKNGLALQQSLTQDLIPQIRKWQHEF